MKNRTKSFLLLIAVAVATLSFTFVAEHRDDANESAPQAVSAPSLTQEPVGGFYADVVR